MDGPQNVGLHTSPLHFYIGPVVFQDSAQATVEGDTWGEEQPDASQDEVPGEAEEQSWEDEEIQEEETELGEEAVGEDGEPPPEEADLFWKVALD